MNPDKDFYDRLKIDGQEAVMADYIKPYVDQWMPLILKNAKPNMKVLDLGAGTCTTSLIISRSPSIAEIHCCDISATRMNDMSKTVQRHIGGDFEKIRFHEVDFNVRLPFEDGFFDLIVMDASLHHSRSIWGTLDEVRRLTADDGFFIAQREAYTSPLTHKRTFRRIMESEEYKAGVSENAYLTSQYDYYLRACGFIPKFYPVYENRIFALLRFLNGIVFSKYNIISRPNLDHFDRS